MHPSNATQKNIFGDNNINIIPQRDQLGNTIDKVFQIISTINTALGSVGSIEKKIQHNQLSTEWRAKISLILCRKVDIEAICDSDTSVYSSGQLDWFFHSIYVEQFQTLYLNEELTAHEVMKRLCEYCLDEFKNNNIKIESHDELILPYLVVFTFINCGVLEKP